MTRPSGSLKEKLFMYAINNSVQFETHVCKSSFEVAFNAS